MQTAIVKAFAESPDWSETSKRFDRMKKLVKKLSDKELQMILDAFAKNDQLHGAAYLRNNHDRLRKFLSDTTGKSFNFDGNRIIEEKEKDDFPF